MRPIFPALLIASALVVRACSAVSANNASTTAREEDGQPAADPTLRDAPASLPQTPRTAVPGIPGVPPRPGLPGTQPGVAEPPTKSGIDLKAMDTKADPCQDFFQYTCGGWLQSNPIPADRSRWAVDNVLSEQNQGVLQDILEAAASSNASKDPDGKKLGDFWSSCMDTSAIEARGISPIAGDLARVDGLSSRESMAAEIARLHRQGVAALFVFTSAQDFEDSSRMMGSIDQQDDEESALSLPDRDYYLEPKYAADLKAFGEHAAKMFELAGDPAARAKAEAGAVVEVETALARIFMDRETRRDPLQTNKKLAWPALKKLTPSFDWDAYRLAAGAPSMAVVEVGSLPYFSKLDGVLKSLPLWSWKSYLRWHVIHSNAALLPSALDNENFAFFGRRLEGQKVQRPRWKRCVSWTDASLGDALGREYVKGAFDASAKRQTLAMVGDIESAMKDDIESASWMTPETKVRALEKLGLVRNKIGYPDKWKDYSTLRVVRGDALGNMRRADGYAFARQLSKIGKPTDRQEWDMTPPTVNAYYDPANNDINFPAGILQPPFYDPKADDAANMGATGATIGHELTHAFDDEGRHYDGRGNLKDWWTSKDQAAFERRAQGIVDQFSKFVVAKDPGGDAKKEVRVNGKLTLGENTADNGGLRIAYAAFLKRQASRPSRVMDGFTPAQRFFIGYGQSWCSHSTEESAKLQTLTNPHALDKFRALGPVSSMSEFQQAFSCKAGDAMVNPNPTRVW